MKNRFWILVALLCVGLAFSGPYDTWSNYRAVTVNTTTAAVTGTVTNFPLLVRLTNADAAHGSDVLAASATGADVRFTDATGATALSYQIETWSATSAAIWVKVPSIAGSATTTINMYWGKSGQTTLSSGPAVFDTANGFAAVFHFNKGDTTSEQDATINAFNASEFGQPKDTVGIIGRTRSLDGATQHFMVDNSVTSPVLDFRPTSNYTISNWFYQTAGTAQKVMVDKGDNNWSLAVATGPYFELQGARSYSCLNSSATATTAGYCVANTNAPTIGGPTILASQAGIVASWHHIAGTFTGGSGAFTGATAIAESLYIDGALVSVGTSSGATTGTPTYTYGVSIGALVSGATPGATWSRWWNGYLDEMEISKTVRSASWVKLSYATQAAAQTAVTLGPTQSTVTVIPGSPSGVTGIGGNSQVTVSWTAPTTGSPVVTYTVTSSPTSAGCTTASTSCIVTGLTNGTAYNFTVTATNTAGTSAGATTASAVTPNSISGTPNVVASASASASNAQATVSWTAPAAGVAATGYTATAVQDTSKHCSTTSISTVTCNVTGLTNGTNYTFSVIATNSAGPGPALVTNQVTPVGAPATMVAPTAAVGNGQIVVTWAAVSTAPANGGIAITSYTVTAAPGGATCTGTGASATTCTVTGLTNGTAYTFTVTATNALGTSTASPSASATPATVPGAPAITTVVGASGQVTVTWTAPSSTGGSAITSYKAMAVADTTKSCTTNGTTLTCAVTGLTNTTAYTFQVKAINSAGAGAASTASAPVTSLYSFTKDLGMRMTNSSMSLRLPEISGTAQVSVMDIWGRVVWSKRVNAGAREVSWGTGSSSNIVPGLYIVRLTLQDANHKSHLAAESKILLTP